MKSELYSSTTNAWIEKVEYRFARTMDKLTKFRKNQDTWKVLTGKNVSLTLNGKKIAFASNVSFNLNGYGYSVGGVSQLSKEGAFLGTMNKLCKLGYGAGCEFTELGQDPKEMTRWTTTATL